jgi:hypothetical protein
MLNQFGRYSDAFKSKEKVNFWREAVENFEQKKYFDSFRSFVKYAADEESQNIALKDNGDSLEIKFLQGTKLIKVNIDNQHVVAESDIASFSKPGIAFMRRLLELNYTLYYTRFSLKDNLILLKFDSSIVDCSPSKFYYAIKELALKADKQDDLLIKDFNLLQPINEVETISVPDIQKKIKYKYYRKWIDESLKKVSTLNENTYEGGISYLLLSTIYKIDFFLLPEGNFVNQIEKLNSIYFANDNKSFTDKNNNLKQELVKLSNEPESNVINSFYETVNSFSLLSPTNFNMVLNVINDNHKNVKWYLDNKHEDIALAVYEYILGYCLYMYGMVKCITHLFKLAIVLINYDYYTEINGESVVKYFKEKDKLDDKIIVSEIKQAIEESKNDFPALSFNTDLLDFTSLLHFLSSYLKEIQNLNFNV